MAHLLRGEKYAFLHMKPPPGYVAGVGRGASGFSTRADIGPAQIPDAPDTEDGGLAGRFDDADDTGILAGSSGADDKEADRLYAMVDSRMAQRHDSAKRTSTDAPEAPSIADQFLDLKDQLRSVSSFEWDSIPDAANTTGKRRRTDDRSYAVPDSLLLANVNGNAVESTVQDSENALGQSENTLGQSEDTPDKNDAPSITDFAEIGKAREKMLALQLENAAKAESQDASIETSAYLRDLDSHASDIAAASSADVKKSQALFKSLTRTNPSYGPGWVGYARTEYSGARNVDKAKKIIIEGCAKAPKSQDVWLTMTDILDPSEARKFLPRALAELPQSETLWLRAVDLEKEPERKKNVLKNAIQQLPSNARLWKQVVQLEESKTDAILLMNEAVKLVPDAIDLCVDLARMHIEQNESDLALETLRKALDAIPSSVDLWIASAHIHEELKLDCDTVVSDMVTSLAQHNTHLSREAWFARALDSETHSYPRTAQAIVFQALDKNLPDSLDDRENTWLDMADDAEAQGAIACSRSVYVHVLALMPDRMHLWRLAAEFESRNTNPAAASAILAQAVHALPTSYVLWLMLVKSLWTQDRIDEARTALHDASVKNPHDENIWLAAVKFEFENGLRDRARSVLKNALEAAPSERVYIKAAVLDRDFGEGPEAAITTASDGLAKFPSSPKLLIIAAQCRISLGRDPTDTRNFLQKATKKAPKFPPLWILAARFEEDIFHLRIKARLLLENGLVFNSLSETLWLERIFLEDRDASEGLTDQEKGTSLRSLSKAAESTLARALQAVPSSDILNALHAMSAPRAERMGHLVDALKRTNNGPYTVLSVGRLFWAQRKLDKARRWFFQSCTENPDCGDAYAWCLKFEQDQTDSQEKRLLDLFQKSAPRHGYLWPVIAKDTRNAARDHGDLLVELSKLLDNSLPLGFRELKL